MHVISLRKMFFDFLFSRFKRLDSVRSTAVRQRPLLTLCVRCQVHRQWQPKEIFKRIITVIYVWISLNHKHVELGVSFCSKQMNLKSCLNGIPDPITGRKAAQRQAGTRWPRHVWVVSCLIPTNKEQKPSENEQILMFKSNRRKMNMLFLLRSFRLLFEDQPFETICLQLGSAELPFLATSDQAVGWVVSARSFGGQLVATFPHRSQQRNDFSRYHETDWVQLSRRQMNLRILSFSLVLQKYDFTPNDLLLFQQFWPADSWNGWPDRNWLGLLAPMLDMTFQGAGEKEISNNFERFQLNV